LTATNCLLICFQLLLLSCCRGNILREFNRAPDGFESSTEFPWPENEVTLLYQPIRKVMDESFKKRKWSETAFPVLEIPVDCYLMFSTLPDSR